MKCHLTLSDIAAAGLLSGGAAVGAALAAGELINSRLADLGVPVSNPDAWTMAGWSKPAPRITQAVSGDLKWRCALTAGRTICSPGSLRDARSEDR